MLEITRPLGAAILLQRRIHNGTALVTGLGSSVKFTIRRQSDGRYWDGSAFTNTTYVELNATEPYAAGGGAANNHNKGLYTYSLGAAAAASADVLEWASVYSSGGIDYVESGEIRLVGESSVDLGDMPDELHLLHQAFVGDSDVEIDGGEHRILDTDGETLLATARFAETIVVDGANWTNATKYVVLAGAFADYLWKDGDEFTLTAGTGCTAGQYAIASKVDDDTIELAADINGAGGDVADNSIEGVIRTGRAMRRVTLE